MGLPRSWDMQRRPKQKVCMFSRGEQGWDILDEDLARDVEATKSSSVDQVTRIVGTIWVDREDFAVTDVHVWTKKTQ